MDGLYPGHPSVFTEETHFPMHQRGKTYIHAQTKRGLANYRSKYVGNAENTENQAHVEKATAQVQRSRGKPEHNCPAGAGREMPQDWWAWAFDTSTLSTNHKMVRGVNVIAIEAHAIAWY
jgi:hypothetical protein